MVSYLEVGLPSTASIIVRIVLITTTTIAFCMCMSKPNPPPSKANRKHVSRLENVSSGLLRPLTVGFTFTPATIELVASFVRLALPPAYDTVSGTCAERISFHVPALVGCLLTLCGMGIRLWCYWELGALFTFELALLPSHKLIKTGPYAFIRHPSYMGGLLGLTGMTIVNACRGSWAAECGASFPWWGIGWGIVFGVSTLVIIDRCSREDRILREAFREEWEAWRAQVRWSMLPGVF